MKLLTLDWVERGGPKVAPPSQVGFGSRLLTQILGSHSGNTTAITYGELGVECRLYLDLD